jgi:methionyl-tRNA formyltransferase
LDRLASGTIAAVPQPEAGVTYAAKLGKAEARIDWTARAVEIERKVRAFNPWPIAETLYEGEQLRVLKAKADMEESTRTGGLPPGTLLSVSERAVLVQCGMGRLAISEVQRPGKRPISARDFANSAPLVGRRLG